MKGKKTVEKKMTVKMKSRGKENKMNIYDKRNAFS